MSRFRAARVEQFTVGPGSPVAGWSGRGEGTGAVLRRALYALGVLAILGSSLAVTVEETPTVLDAIICDG